MPYGLYLSAEGAHAQAQRLEVLANNLANIDTPGFKRDLAVFQARLTEAVQRGEATPGSRTLNDLSGGTLVRETRTDFSPGVLKVSSNDKDLAINGDGFFQVRRGNETLLTRAGNFQLNKDGVLCTQDGDAVLSDGGVPISIDPDPAFPWTLREDGTIVQSGTTQNLSLVQPRSLGDLVKIGDNLFRPLGPTAQVDGAERHIVQNRLEGSGVKPTLEMMEMIETSRAFEANVNMIRTQDQAMGSLVGRLLKEN